MQQHTWNIMHATIDNIPKQGLVTNLATRTDVTANPRYGCMWTRPQIKVPFWLLLSTTIATTVFSSFIAAATS